MNTELITKYREEFDWWLDGGALQIKWEGSDEWVIDYVICSTDLWEQNIKNIEHIVIDDAYVEFRKALAEGKTIQVSKHFTGSLRSDYEDCDFKEILELMKTEKFVILDENPIYRIKPDEPKFKVGDWVRCNNGPLYQIKDVFEMNNTIYTTSIKLKDRLEWNDGIHGELEKLRDCKLWKPKMGDWCWFWCYEDYKCTKQLAKFIGKNYDEPKWALEVMLQNGDSAKFSYCEPFIGKLPSNIKG